ncbi:hypothetical protein VMCG_02696 [Cytospora schulzeri]|uniref:Nephrocystin 3-like N-terminal domain-containing protein n=1 Tax=Cytospora schulzeri TaxID=448051 RepID=A0A423WZ64_9PEZI|nr:hypothetical protein VMCG_02696 [Valsa malicola]
MAIRAWNLAESGRHLEDIGTSITQQLKNCSPVLTAKNKAFIKVANQCADDARALQDEAAYLAPKKAHEIRAAISAAGRSFWRRRRLERLEANLLRSQRTLETSLLRRLCDESEAHAIQDRNDFANLDRTLQQFIKNYADGQRTLSGLLQSSIQILKNHVSENSTRTCQKVTVHITNELSRHRKGIVDNITASTEEVPQKVFDHLWAQKCVESTAKQRQCLLDSLKYPEMNSRYNKISETCAKTFEWVFNSTASGMNGAGDPGAAMSKWLKSDEKLFWISGKPGSGKSSLTKFIVTHQETQRALVQWRQRTRIVSHFLWLPGSEMQKSIQGMLCSLLHQSLHKHYSALELIEQGQKLPAEGTILLRFPHIKEKSSHSDWSMTELTDVLLYHLESTLDPYCFFLDGLDEISSKDGPWKLIRIIERLSLLPSIKLCVSSRPEHVFTKHFEKFPSIKMQDLIAPDVRKYAYDVLEEHNEASDLPENVSSIIDTIVDKADGVFLWAVLVLESFRRGLSNGDTWDQLEQRLHKVPMDLMDLYRDMWSRLGGDRTIYKTTAGLYISLLMKYKTLDGMERLLRFRNLTVMDFVAASSSPSELDDFLGQKALAPNLELEKKCEQTITNINIHCAGLLAIRSERFGINVTRSEWWQPARREASYGFLLPYWGMEVDFIHRSAYEFLIGTKDGQQIWKDCNSTEFEKLCQLFRGRMARLRVLGSIAPWMREKGMVLKLRKSQEGFTQVQLKNFCNELWAATVTKKVTSADAEILLSIMSRASINGDLAYKSDPRKSHLPGYRQRHGRPWEFLALASLHFDTFVENYIVRHVNSITTNILWSILDDLCSHPGFPQTSKTASFPRTMSCLLQRIKQDSKSSGAGADAPVDILLCDWPVGHHRDTITDMIVTLLQAGADLGRRLYLVIWCTPDGPSNCTLQIGRVFHHEDKASGFLEPHSDWSFHTWFLTGTDSILNGPGAIPMLLNASVSFAMECVIAWHFREEKDRPALLGLEGPPDECYLEGVDSAWIGPEAEDYDMGL